MGFRFPSPRSNSLGNLAVLYTHCSMHSKHPTHFASSTYRGFRRTLTLKLPTKPSTETTSEYERSVMFGWFFTAVIFGVRMHAAQSRVGKVLSNLAMCPPMDGSRSTRETGGAPPPP